MADISLMPEVPKARRIQPTEQPTEYDPITALDFSHNQAFYNAEDNSGQSHNPFSSSATFSDFNPNFFTTSICS
jgi:hypothetical protein